MTLQLVEYLKLKDYVIVDRDVEGLELSYTAGR